MRNLAIIVVCAVCLSFPFSKVQACGHEGWFAGVGYMQLLQYTFEKQLVSPTVTSTRDVDWNTRWGAYGKVGYDFCGSRFGVEVPLSFNRQRLNRSEIVNVFGIDANAIIHLIETRKGADFYWIAGTGVNIVTEGPIKNRSGGAGINFNFGPGLQYFVSKKKPKAAIGISVPFKYTLYLGSHLSRNQTSVFGFPIQVGFTIGF